jgi:dTDP-4-dehydrorhamnose 3,5-epimerase
MQIIDTKLKGCFEIQPAIHKDLRGEFVKTFHLPTFSKAGVSEGFPEEYYSVSKKHVIRGLHFQLPPDDHKKLVNVISGTVMDVVVDLRVGSPTYQQHMITELSDFKRNALLIPSGMAHGFCVLSDSATMIYRTSTVHSPKNDSGILWNSIGIDWPTLMPIVSERDLLLPKMNKFISPFGYKQEEL